MASRSMVRLGGVKASSRKTEKASAERAGRDDATPAGVDIVKCS
jgi:hypothetical protein